MSDPVPRCRELLLSSSDSDGSVPITHARGAARDYAANVVSAACGLFPGEVGQHRFSRLGKQPEPDAVEALRSRGAPPSDDKQPQVRHE